MTKHVRTKYLEIGYEEWRADGDSTIVLVHGWPDDVHCWGDIASALVSDGCRVLTPHLRGCTATRFLDDAQPRSGQIAALGHDLAEFLDTLDVQDAVVAGYDWGARAGYVVAALHPDRLRGLVAMAAPYPPSDTDAPISYDLAKSYWYEWFCATDYGRRAFDVDRRGISKYLWQSWSPHWHFSDDEFDRAAQSWSNADWPRISVHAYLHRWTDEPGDPAYDRLEEQLALHPKIGVPTIVLHGDDDRANLPHTTEHQDRFFAGHYQRRVLPGIGHFVPREAPGATLDAIRELVARAKSAQ